MNDECEIPYGKDTGLAVAILVMTFSDIIQFPPWCVVTFYALVVAVPVCWTAYAMHRQAYTTTVKYLLFSVVAAIIFIFKVFQFIP